ncbi:MAG: UPF0058 family protein [Methanobrevibacter sp.]|jgi:hypothetical protein|nr:UPF0058 family protein [Methanobrevibacter sp.]
MNKDEIIQIHQFLLYVLKYIETEEKMHKTCNDYISLDIRPHHIQKTKAAHKHAIFILSYTISQVIQEKDEKSLPSNVKSALNEVIIKSKKEMEEKAESDN